MKIAPEILRVNPLEVRAEQASRYRFIGSLRRVRGLILFEYDLTTGQLIRAHTDQYVEVGLDGKPVFHAKSLYRDFCLYVQATNEENAMKKVRKTLRDYKYDIRKLF